MSRYESAATSNASVDSLEMLRIARETPLLQLTPLQIASHTEFAALFADFGVHCTTRHFLAAAARHLYPYEAAEYAVADTVRKVVFAHSHGRISELDLHSYVYIVALGVVARATQAPFLENGSVFDERNYFWKRRDSIYNSVSITLKTLKTELKCVESPIYQAVELVQCIDAIYQLKVSPEEELEFDRIASRVCELCRSVFCSLSKMCCDNDVTIERIYHYETGVSQHDFEIYQIILILATIAAIPLLKLSNYVQEVANVAEYARQCKRELKTEMARQKKIMSKITEYSGLYLVYNAVVTKQFVYKPFSELTPYEQNEIKFQATANLYRYISMKRQLHVDSSMRLFQDSVDQSIEKLTQDDLIAEQNLMKMEQLKQTRHAAEQNRYILEQCIETAGAYYLMSKAQEVCQIENFSLISKQDRPQQKLIEVGKSTSSTLEQRYQSNTQSILTLNFDYFEVSVRNQLFQAFSVDFGARDMIKDTVDVLLICRALYCSYFFRATHGYEKAFCTIIQHSSQTLASSQHAKDEELSIEQLSNVKSQTKYLLRDVEDRIHPDMLNQSVTRTISLYQQARGNSLVLCDSHGQATKKLDSRGEVSQIELRDVDLEQPYKDQIAVQIMQNVPDFRLISDTILTSQLHLFIMQYIRWVSGRNKLEQREQETEYLEESERIQRHVVQLRILTNYLGSMFLHGGNDIGYVVYIGTFSETIDQILLNPALLELLDDDEVGYMLIAMYKMPFYEDYFQLLKAGFKRAFNANTVIQAQIRGVLQDLWVYAQNSGDDYELGRLLYDGQ